MDADSWNHGHLTGSGHAQSMLLHGTPLLSSVRVPAPVELLDGLRDPLFPGRVALWWRVGRDEHIELRWRHASRGAQVDARALAHCFRALAIAAVDMELESLDELHGEEAMVADDGSIWPQLQGAAAEARDVQLVFHHSERLVGCSGAEASFGWWALLNSSGGPVIQCQGPYSRRVRRVPVGLACWTATRLPAVLQELGERRSDQPSAGVSRPTERRLARDATYRALAVLLARIPEDTLDDLRQAMSRSGLEAHCRRRFELFEAEARRRLCSPDASPSMPQGPPQVLSLGLASDELSRISPTTLDALCQHSAYPADDPEVEPELATLHWMLDSARQDLAENAEKSGPRRSATCGP